MAEFGSKVYLVDQQDFRRATLKNFLADWSRENSVSITAFAPDELLKVFERPGPCRMIIFSLGGSSLRSGDIEQRVRIAKALNPDVVSAIMSDANDAREVRAALHLGVEGFLPSGMQPELVLQALSFILNGGSYFPPSAMRETARSDDASPPSSSDAISNATSNDTGETPSRAAGIAKDAMHNETHSNATDERSIASGAKGAIAMTGRQREVLDLLKNGEPNKVIARRLEMTEATVKVHVRQIMRKLGASNRTQAAVYATSIIRADDVNGECDRDRDCEDKRDTLSQRQKSPALRRQTATNGAHA